MISEIQKLKDAQSAYNQNVSINDKDNIIIIFQYITMTGLVFIVSIILTYLYIDVNKSLKFNNPIPLLVTDKSFYTTEVKNIFIKQIFFDLYSARTGFELDIFNLFNTDSLIQNQMINKFRDFSNTKKDVLGFEIVETFTDYGSSFIDRRSGIVKNTKSKYTVVIAEDYLSPGAQVTSNIRFKAYEMTFDNFGKIIDFSESADTNLTTKHDFISFLKDITPASLPSNVDFNSPISALALSNMNIKEISFNRLEMKTKHNGAPIGIVTLDIDRRHYTSEITIATDGKPSMLIALK